VEELAAAAALRRGGGGLRVEGFQRRIGSDWSLLDLLCLGRSGQGYSGGEEDGRLVEEGRKVTGEGEETVEEVMV
jgi:hypothetical protein